MKILPAIVLGCLLVLAASGQTAALSGVLTDLAGAAIPGAGVKATAKDGREFKDRTNSIGVYALRLPAGTYRIEFKMTGCDGFIVPEYVIGPNADAVLDAEIPVETCKVSDASSWLAETPPVVPPVASRAGMLLPNDISARPLQELPAAPKPGKNKKKKSHFNSKL